jgi:hypothetical protein
MTAEATLQIAGDTPILELGHLEGLTLVGLVRVIPAHHRLIMIPKDLITTLGITSGCVRRHYLQFGAVSMCPSICNLTMFDVGGGVGFCWILYSYLQGWYLKHSDKLLTGEGREGGGGGAKSYDGEDAWSSTNRSILSGYILREAHTKKGKD